MSDNKTLKEHLEHFIKNKKAPPSQVGSQPWVSPLTVGEGVSPLTVGDTGVVPLTVGDGVAPLHWDLEYPQRPTFQPSETFDPNKISQDLSDFQKRIDEFSKLSGSNASTFWEDLLAKKHEEYESYILTKDSVLINKNDADSIILDGIKELGLKKILKLIPREVLLNFLKEEAED
jgi:hypothetical protein